MAKPGQEVYLFGIFRVDRPGQRARAAVSAHQASGREKRALSNLESIARADPSDRNKRAVKKYKREHGL